MAQIQIYTDGACSGNPGPGGWAAILKYGDSEKDISGYVDNTTNNRMELFAVIKALAALNRACDVIVYSDSAYLVNAFNKGWIDKWQINSWKNSKKQEVLNKDLWLQLLAYTKQHTVDFVKVKGHSDNKYNNLCDQLAVQQIKTHRL